MQRHPDDVLFWLCPPLPPARKNCHSQSDDVTERSGLVVALFELNLFIHQTGQRVVLGELK